MSSFQTPHVVGADQRDALRDKTAHGVAEEVVPRHPQGVGEDDNIVCHLPDRGGHRSGRPGHASVVENDDLALLGERVEDNRIPGVQIAAVVLEQEQRQRRVVRIAVAAIRVPHPVPSVDTLVRCRQQTGCLRHALLSRPSPPGLPEPHDQCHVSRRGIPPHLGDTYGSPHRGPAPPGASPITTRDAPP